MTNQKRQSLTSGVRYLEGGRYARKNPGTHRLDREERNTRAELNKDEELAVSRLIQEYGVLDKRQLDDESMRTGR